MATASGPVYPVRAYQSDFRMWRAKEFMRRNLQRTLSLAEVSRHVDMSISRFSHAFKDHSSLAPGRWLKSARLERARELLEKSPELSVKEIAASVGLNSSRLAKEFRKEFGVAPKAYRQRALRGKLS